MAMLTTLLLLWGLALPAQAPAKPVPPAGVPEWQTRSFDLKYADPEQIRALFSGRSFVMDANRSLRVLTVHGSAAFLKEVEDTVKRFDVPLPPSANLQITVYLLTSAAQAPAGLAIPAELSGLSKEFGTPVPKLADSQMLRVREGQSGLVTALSAKPESASLARVWLQASAATPGPKGDRVSLYGLRVWVDMPVVPPATSPPPLRADPDVAADVDIDANQAVLVSKVGVEQPVMVVVRATVIR